MSDKSELTQEPVGQFNKVTSIVIYPDHMMLSVVIDIDRGERRRTYNSKRNKRAVARLLAVLNQDTYVKEIRMGAILGALQINVHKTACQYCGTRMELSCAYCY